MKMTEKEAFVEAQHVIASLQGWLGQDGRAVIGVSGGLDSDVVARLLVMAIGRQRVKTFIVIQDEMDPRHLKNARDLAAELDMHLAEIDLRGFPERFVSAMSAADPSEAFQSQGLLDPARAKCSLRTPIYCSYQDRGYNVIGTSNRTEIETGFFLPLGDGVWHFGPLAHLYKSEVIAIARVIGCSEMVLMQPPSAGFWPDQEDLEDLCYWLINGGPIGRERDFSEDDVAEVARIRAMLTIERVDSALHAFESDLSDNEAAAAADLPPDVIASLRQLTEAARRIKHRQFGIRLKNRI